MNSFGFPLARQQPFLTNPQQFLQLAQLMNIAQQPTQPLLNPIFLNQLLFSQQMQAMQMLLMQTTPPLTESPNSNASSTRTIVMGEAPPSKLKIEEEIEKHDAINNSLDVDAITKELRALIRYLASVDIPSQTHIKETFQLLPTINQEIIPLIVDRHQSQKKTKEEQIKFVLRKCFKFLKNKLNMNEVIITPLELEKRLYKEYFDGTEDMIPFRENSNMKTMNAQYLKKIFQSPKFVEAFREYLEAFDQIWDDENEEKIDNMVKQVLKLIQQNRIQKLSTYRRIPWVPSIKEKCRNLALAMLKYAPGAEHSEKHIKTEEASEAPAQ